jgi:hypothetical protein
MSSLVASGTVRVRCLDTGREWDEIVEVFEQDMEDTDGSELTPEDVARRVAINQASPSTVETLEADLS